MVSRINSIAIIKPLVLTFIIIIDSKLFKLNGIINNYGEHYDRR